MIAEHTLVYGVAIKKNADIKHLADLVDLAQNRVTEYQAIVDSLQVKSDQVTGFLSQATTNKASALANFKQARDVLSSINGLYSSFELAATQAERATSGAAHVSERMADLISKLIFSVEIINKVTQLINKQKALNPMLPDSLVAFMSKATTDGNTAVALTLTALQSCYVAESTLFESRGAVKLAADQVTDLKARFESGWNVRSESPQVEESAVDGGGVGVLVLLHQVYQRALEGYENALWNNDSVTSQLAYAQARLASAIMKLSSCQAGLKAATVAARAA